MQVSLISFLFFVCVSFEWKYLTYALNLYFMEVVFQNVVHSLLLWNLYETIGYWKMRLFT
jgi:hypothetical protein